MYVCVRVYMCIYIYISVYVCMCVVLQATEQVITFKDRRKKLAVLDIFVLPLCSW